MHRPTIGIIALALLLAALVLRIWYPEQELWISACLRVGLVMTALWLAHPQVSRIHPWLLAVGVAVLLAALLFRQPRILVMALAILFLITRLQSPRAGRNAARGR